MTKIFYVASQKFVSFLAEIDGKHSKLALKAGFSARTIARIKGGARTSSATAKAVYKASLGDQFGFSGEFKYAFVLASESK